MEWYTRGMKRPLVTIVSFCGIVLLAGGSYLYFFGENRKQEKSVFPNEEFAPNKKDEGEKTESHPVSFQQLIDRQYQAPALQRGAILEETSQYTKYAVTYQSDNLTISGVLYVPQSSAPSEGYPVLITNHGYIDTSVYTTGRGLKREQIYFAARGYVVFHPDYRNHAGSTKTENDPIRDRLGYIVDIIHAVESLKSSDVSINKENITLLGHSMGGGATLAAVLVKPDVANRIVLYAPVTANALDSYNRYQKDDPRRAEMVRLAYGLPEENKEFWDGLNGERYYERLAVPVQIYQGTEDQDVPYEWATHIRDGLQAQNKNVELITYQGEAHEFSFAWEEFMRGVEQFIRS